MELDKSWSAIHSNTKRQRGRACTLPQGGSPDHTAWTCNARAPKIRSQGEGQRATLGEIICFPDGGRLVAACALCGLWRLPAFLAAAVARSGLGCGCPVGSLGGFGGSWQLRLPWQPWSPWRPWLRWLPLSGLDDLHGRLAGVPHRFC